MEDQTKLKMMGMLDQKETSYTPVSTQRGKACSSCLWWRSDHCHIVADYPEPIVSNGYCNRHEIATPLVPQNVAPLPVTIVEPAIMLGEMSRNNANEDGLFSRLWDRFTQTMNPQHDGAFTVQKDLNGKWRWMATFTNNFKDRDGEIISEKALDDYIERVNSGLIPLPELWLGHIEGTKHGQADMVFGVGSFVTAVGSFDDTPDAVKAIDFYKKNASKVSLSHGFTFPSWGLKNGIYDVVNVFEISVLPAPLVASNPFTEFEVNNMKQISPEQQTALSLVFGKDKVDTIIESRRQQSEEIKAAGVAFKDFAEVPAETETSADEAATIEVEAVKPMANLLTDLLEAQGELLSVLTAQGKAIQAMQESVATKEAATVTEKATLAAEVATLKAQVEKLSAELSLTPVRASEAAATAVTPEQAKSIVGQPPQETDSFWKA